MQNFVSDWVDGYCSVVLVTSVSVDAVKVVEVVNLIVVFNFGLVDGFLVVSVA